MFLVTSPEGVRIGTVEDENKAFALACEHEYQISVRERAFKILDEWKIMGQDVSSPEAAGPEVMSELTAMAVAVMTRRFPLYKLERVG